MPAIIPIVAAVGGALVSGAMNKKSNDASARANDAAADATRKQGEIAAQQYDDWKTQFMPLGADLTSMAKTAGSVEEQERAAELASGDVTQAFGRAKTDLSSRLASYGIDPGSGKYATSFSRMGLSEAATGAGAQNKARTDVMDKAKAFKMGVYGLGKGMDSSAMSALGQNAMANAQMGANHANTASRNAAGIGSIVQQGINWWNRPTAGAGTPYAGGPDPRSFDGN